MSQPWKCKCGELNADNFTYCYQCTQHKSKSEIMSTEQTKGIWSQGNNTNSDDWMNIYCNGKIIAKTLSLNKKGQRQTTDFQEEEANTRLIVEAGQVLNETGLTPRQLKEQRDELLNTMEKIKTMTTNAGIKFIINKAICKQD